MTLKFGIRESRTNHRSSLDNNTLMDWQKWTLNDARTFTSASAKALNKEMSALLNTSTADLAYLQAQVSAGQEDTLTQLHKMLTGAKSEVESQVLAVKFKTLEVIGEMLGATMKAVFQAPSLVEGLTQMMKAKATADAEHLEPLLIRINAVSAKSNAFLRSEGKNIQNSLNALKYRLASSGNRLKGQIERKLASVRKYPVFLNFIILQRFWCVCQQNYLPTHLIHNNLTNNNLTTTLNIPNNDKINTKQTKTTAHHRLARLLSYESLSHSTDKF